MTLHRKKVIAIASGGGHWIQLKRLTPAFEGHRLVLVTVNAACRLELEAERFYVVPDATRWDKLRLIRLALRILWIVLRERPDVVLSTGAAPGYFGLLFGKLLGARTIWVDSIANTEHLSLSGQKVRKLADLWLTQWPHLESPSGPYFRGSVL